MTSPSLQVNAHRFQYQFHLILSFHHLALRSLYSCYHTPPFLFLYVTHLTLIIWTIQLSYIYIYSILLLYISYIALMFHIFFYITHLDLISQVFPATTIFSCSLSFLGFWIHACDYRNYLDLHGLPHISILCFETFKFLTKKIFC